MKKFLTFTMVAMTLICIVCVATACGEKGDDNDSTPQQQSELFDYELDESGEFYWVTEKDRGFVQEVVVVPSEHDGLPVKGMKNLIVDNSSVKEIVIPECIEKIQRNSLWHLTKLEKITYNAINANVYNSSGEVKGEMISYVDYENPTIKELVIGNKVKHLPALFENGDNLNVTIIKELTIPASVETSNLALWSEEVADYAPLKVNISSVEQWLKIFTQKGNYLVRNNYINLYVNGTLVNEMTIPDSVTELTQYRAFRNINVDTLKTIKIHAGVETIYGDTLLGNTTIEVDENNPYYASRDGILYDKNFTKIIAIPDGISGEVTMPATVNKGDLSFGNCKMSKLVVDCDWKSVASYNLFKCANLETIVINGTCNTICTSAFSDCPNLKTIILPATLTKIEGKFCEDSTNATIYCMATSRDNITDNRKSDEKARVKLLIYSESQPTENASSYWHFDTDGTTPVAWA